jgi:hypothetical protein
MASAYTAPFGAVCACHHRDLDCGRLAHSRFDITRTVE